MLLDVLSMMLVVKAQDELATRQLLKELTFCSDETYQSNVVLKGVGLCGHIGRHWITGLY